MRCFPEFTYSIYLDQELSAGEAQAVEAHLVRCPACRVLLDRMRIENQGLIAALLGPAEEAAAVVTPQHRVFPLAWILPVMMGGVIALSSTLRWISNDLPAFANWVNPFSRTALLNFFLSLAFFVADERQPIVHWFGWVVTGVALALLMAGGIFLLLRRWPLPLALIGATFLVMGLARPASALERRSGQTVTVPAGETVNGNLAAGAQSVEITGIVNGNLIASAQRVTISGTVTGDVIAFSQTLDIEGTVQGNVFSWAQFVTVRGKVGQTVHAFAESFDLAPGGQVGGDALAFCQTVNINGQVGDDVAAQAGSVMLRGSVGHTVKVTAGNVTVDAPAHVGNDLIASVKRTRDFSLRPGAVIGGNTRVELSASRFNHFLTLHFYLWKAIELAGVWVTGLLLFWLFPSLFTGKIQSSPDLLKAIGAGFLVLVATPVAAALVALTLVGLPVAILALAVWMAGIFLAKVFLATVIGQRLAGGGAGEKKLFAAPLLLGLVIIFVAVAMPYIGMLDHFLVILIGYGLVLDAARQAWARRRPPAV